MDIKKWIISNIYNNKRLKSNHNKYIDTYYYSLIEKETSFLKEGVSLQERIYCIVNNIKSAVVCNNEKCNNPVNFNSFSKGYYNYCSNKCVSGSKDVIEKTKQSYLKKYGVENIFQLEEIKNKIRQSRRSSENNEKKIITKVYPEMEVKKSNMTNRDYENEIIEFINIKNINIHVEGVIPSYYLDMYFPDHKLAIEFNDLFSHSKHPKNYHLNKTELCQKEGIQLLHIFENEWVDSTRQEIWKSIINGKLGNNSKIHARKTEIKEINDNKVVKEFLNNNHLQGFVGSSVKLGLFDNDELVSVMIFGKTRFSKKYEYEMIRLCTKKFITVVGGASKLFKYFIDNYKPNSVISYADRRYSNGNLYKKIGFDFSHNSYPNYWYFENGSLELFSRVKFQKHKLEKMLDSFDNNKSEVENMIDNNYSRIFDCGNIIYTWKN